MYSGSIVAIVTPMTETGEVDYAAWERLLGWHLAEGTDGIVVCGTTGESPTVTLVEALELTRRAVARVAGRIPVIAGSGTNDTAGSIERTRALAAAGADAVLVVTPYYNRPTQEGLYQHFMAIADDSPVPVILYNVPGRTGVDLLPETAARLGKHPRIVAFKEAVAGVERVRALRSLCGEDLDLLSGDDSTALDAMLAGARGVISVTANVCPAAMSAVCAAALAGDAEAARAADAPLRALHSALSIEPNPIPAKWAVCRLGLAGTGIRLPLTPLTVAAQVAVLAAMSAAGVA
ncbi:MAG: 4-hydroxy-tetrahydrodipicolinate synthase [Pseudomonadota bacterium]|jgi:4-hydroxy-tetrahydrodipicolinate synthase